MNGMAIIVMIIVVIIIVVLVSQIDTSTKPVTPADPYPMVSVEPAQEVLYEPVYDLRTIGSAEGVQRNFLLIDFNPNYVLVRTPATTIRFRDLFAFGQANIVNQPTLEYVDAPETELLGFLNLQNNTVFKRFIAPRVKTLAAAVVAFSNPQLEELAFDEVMESGVVINIFFNSVMTKISFAKMTSFGTIEVGFNLSLVEINLPSLVVSPGFNISNNASLAILEFPSLTGVTDHSVVFSGNAFTEATVDGLLAMFA